MTVRVLIADDEPLARERMRDLLTEVPGFEVIGESADGRETVAAVQALSPDLLFLDIQMPELDGFGVLEQLDPSQMPVVLFLTAFDHYAVKAFEVHAVDYLLKPVDPRRFREAAERAREEIERSSERGITGNLLKAQGALTGRLSGEARRQIRRTCDLRPDCRDRLDRGRGELRAHTFA